MGQKWKWIVLIWMIFWHAMVPVYAADATEEDKAQKEILGYFDFQELEELLKEIFPQEKLGFQTMLKNMMSGDWKDAMEELGDFIVEQLFYEIRNSKETMIHLLVIALVAAVFTNFSGVFQNRQVADMSFFILYLVLITVILKSFSLLLASVEGHILKLLTFMSALGPMFFLAVALSSGSVSSIGFYQIVLFSLYVVEFVVLNMLLPLTQLYLVIQILNHLSKEEILSKLAELLEFVIGWTQKTLLAGVIGLNVIQGLIGPAIDSVKRSVVTRGAEAIPLIGDALGGTAEVVLGTTVLIKNAIGVTGAVICTAICLLPLVQMLIVTFLFKVTAAMVQPISDKRMVGCINSIATGTEMLLKIVFTCGVVFLLTITIVASFTTS